MISVVAFLQQRCLEEKFLDFAGKWRFNVVGENPIWLKKMP